MTMVDLEEESDIAKQKQKDMRNRKHDYCPKCGRPKRCNDPECTRQHCNCNTL
jgi:NADH pyrophosphatase NudC (nudix superfamily)